MKNLRTFRPTGGHILDIDPSEVADQFLTLAQNVHTRKGFPSRIGGRRIAYPVVSGHAPNDPYHLLNLSLNTFNWWMSFGTNNIWAIEGTNKYDISLVGMQAITNPSQWAATLLNGIPVFSNGKDSLLYWDGSGASDAIAVPGFPASTSVKYVVAFRFHLFGLDVDGPAGHFDNQIIWSDAADPGALPATWTPATSNEAGSAILAETAGRLITGEPLNQQLLIYKKESVYPVEYAGQQPDNIFTVGRPIRGFGALGPHTVANLGDRHLVVGNDDVCLFDGLNFKSIAQDRIKKFLANSIDQTYAENAFVVRDLNQRETWVCVPESGSQFCTIAHIWDERHDTWVTRDLNNFRHATTGFVTDTTVSSTWDADSNTWDSDVSAWNEGDTGAITHVTSAEPNTMYVEDTTDLVSITGTIAKYDMSFGDDAQSKLIKNVWIRGTGALTNVEFRLGSRDDTEDSIIWQAWQPARSDGALTIPEIVGRYISIEIRVVGTADWTINKFILDWKFNGSY